jgi:hypothetical protein
MSMTRVLLDVAVNINPGNLPGFGTVNDLVGGLAGWALLLSLAALIIGSISWGFGHATSNIRAAEGGKGAVIISGLVAILIGGGATIINFFFHAGQNLH